MRTIRRHKLVEICLNDIILMLFLKKLLKCIDYLLALCYTINVDIYRLEYRNQFADFPIERNRVPQELMPDRFVYSKR